MSCPGAGLNVRIPPPPYPPLPAVDRLKPSQGYFYRCCSSAGHCGPKNDIQDQALYCGTGCQPGFGKCDEEPKPPMPSGSPGVAQAGETCGPIVNRRCAEGLCCSGSNFCGEFCVFFSGLWGFV